MIEDVLVSLEMLFFSKKFIFIDFMANEETHILLRNPLFDTWRNLIELERGYITMMVYVIIN